MLGHQKPNGLLVAFALYSLPLLFFYNSDMYLAIVALDNKVIHKLFN
jgi:hypothetical protein